MSDLDRDLEAIAGHMLNVGRAEARPPLFSPFREAARRRNYVDPRLAARLAEKDDRGRWIAGVKRRLGLVGIGERGYRIETEIKFRKEETAGRPVREATTHDLTRIDYAFRPEGGGQRGHVSCWSGSTPRVGDYLILRNGDGSSRYRVTGVDPCWGVDPPTMWMADLAFAPRPGVEP